MPFCYPSNYYALRRILGEKIKEKMVEFDRAPFGIVGLEFLRNEPAPDQEPGLIVAVTRAYYHFLVVAKRWDRSVADARAWVEAMLGFQVYSHQLLKVLQASPHGEGHAHSHG